MIAHTRFGLALALTLLAGSALVAQGAISDIDVTAAIKAGQSNKYGDWMASCAAGPTFGQGMAYSMAGGVQPSGYYGINVMTAQGYIAWRAANAKRLYKPFEVADVTEAMRTKHLFLTATPSAPKRTNNTIDVASPIEAVVLKTKDKSERAVQPTNLVLEPTQWKNLLGGVVDGTNAEATFPLEALRELPDADIDIVLVTAAGERRCKIGAKDRLKLLM